MMQQSGKCYNTMHKGIDFLTLRSLNSYEIEDMAVLQAIVFREAFSHNDWKQHFSKLVNAGITSIAIYIETEDEILDQLEIPTLPLKKLKDLKKNLLHAQKKTADNNCYLNMLSENPWFQKFVFVPQFTCEGYLDKNTIPQQEEQLTIARDKVASVRNDGILSEQQAIFIALYTQESVGSGNSFYSLANKYLRERSAQLIFLRPALYVLERSLLALPSIKTVTWRGISVVPDLKKFVEGNAVCFMGICSSSTVLEKAVMFMEAKPPPGIEHKKTLFKLHMNDGKSIGKWSQYEEEKEIVANFGSQWRVLSVARGKEVLLSNGSRYVCDFVIEMDQLKGQRLFRKLKKPTGLNLLRHVKWCQSLVRATNFKAIFSDFFGLLDDMNAQAILEKLLDDLWTKETKSFCGTVSNEDACSKIADIFHGIESLDEELQYNETDLDEAYDVCDRHSIYSAVDLLHKKVSDGFTERNERDFIDLGFSKKHASLLSSRHGKAQELGILYKKLALGGTSENPVIAKPMFDKLRLRHSFIRGCGTVSLYKILHASTDGVMRTAKVTSGAIVTLDNIKLLGRSWTCALEKSDFIIAGVVWAVQLSIASVQLWYGDLTVRQFWKAVAVSTLSTAAGFGAGIGGSLLGAAIGALLGPPGIAVGAIIGGLLGGAIGGIAADIFSRKLLEYFFPNGDEENLNAKRKMYLKALEVFNCTRDSEFDVIRRVYYNLALQNHPDKVDNENKAAAEEKFKRIALAYEIVKTYHDILTDARQTLNVPSETKGKILEEWLKKWTKENRSPTAKQQKSYSILHRHLAYGHTEPRFVRRLFDSDRNLKLDVFQ